MWIERMNSKQPLTVVTYGDSWTYGSVAEGWHDAKGVAANITGSWSMQLKRYLEQVNPQVTFHNTGRGGWTAPEGVEGYNERVAAHAPDLLILNFGINDWRRAVTPAQYREALEHMLNRAQDAGCATILWISGPMSVQSGETYGWPTPIDDSAYVAPFDAYIDVLRALAQERQLPIVDVKQRIEDLVAAGTSITDWFYDAFHFFQPGHDQIFAAMRETIDAQLQRS